MKKGAIIKDENGALLAPDKGQSPEMKKKAFMNMAKGHLSQNRGTYQIS